VAWGFGVRDDATAAHILDETALGRGYQVRNLAGSGYGLGQSYLRLQQNLKELPNPRWIVLTIFPGNDLLDTGSSVRWGKCKPLFVLDGDELDLTNTPVGRFCLRNAISTSLVLNRAYYGFRPIRRIFDRVADDIVLAPDERRRVALALLARIHALAESLGAEFTIVLSPQRADLEGPGTKAFRWFVRHIARGSGVQTIDLRNAIRESGLDVEQLFLDETHFSAAGNRVYAAAVAEHWPPSLK
jgi:hypothetical protein